MKKVLLGLLALAALGLILAACTNPVDGAGGVVPRGAVALNDADRTAALSIVPKVSARTNASGKDISSNSQGAAVPGMYFFWDPKQKDNAYLKVEPAIFDTYKSFVLTTKEANKYWDFLIAPKSGQKLGGDGFYVFFIPKQEKNINGVWICDYVNKNLVAQKLDYTENPVDIPNPDRGFYRGRTSGSWITPAGATSHEVDMRVPVTGDGYDYFLNEYFQNDTDVQLTRLTAANIANQVDFMPSVSFKCFDLANFSSNAYLIRWPEPSDHSNPPDEWRAANSGKTQPLTADALAYIRKSLDRVRATNATVHLKFSYDGSGFNYRQGSGERGLQNPEPGCDPTAPGRGNGPLYGVYESCGIPGHEEKNWVQYHIWQLKPIFYEYEDIITCVAAGFFGAWGEMHTSLMAQDPVANTWLADALLDAIPPSRSILVHAAGYLAWYNSKHGTNLSFGDMDQIPAPVPGTPESRFGFFNDSYAAGYEEDDDVYNDNGSLTGENNIIAPQATDFDRDKCFEWIYNQNNYHQVEGGSGNGTYLGTRYGIFPSIPYEAFIQRTSHFNGRHSQAGFGRWATFVYNEANIAAPLWYEHNDKTVNPIFDPVYDGKNGLEFMRDRLGYRLVLRDAKASEWVPQNGNLKFEGKIQNVGFGNVVNKKNVWVILKSKTGSATYTALASLDARDWKTPDNRNNRPDNTAGYRDLNFSVNLSAFGKVPAGNYDIFLKITDPLEKSSNLRCIQFANKGSIWNEALGANLVGSTEVL